MKQAMLLAAGLGTRLRPYTDSMPKALVPVAGRPLLHHVIARLKKAGFQRIVVNIHHFGQQIIDDLAANHYFGLDIRISDERDLLLDTGGALKHAAPLFDPEYPVFIHNVDILSNLDISAFCARYQQSPDIAAALVVSPRRSSRQLLFDPTTQHLIGWQNTQSGELRGPIAQRVSPSASLSAQQATPLAFAGIHMISPQLFPLMQSWPEKFSIITFYLDICANRPLLGFVPPAFRLMDAGKAETLAEADAFAQSLMQEA